MEAQGSVEVSAQDAARDALDYVHDGRVRLVVSGVEIEFRVPDLEDQIQVDGQYPLLPGMEAAEETDMSKAVQSFADDVSKVKRFLERVNGMLMVLAVSPKITEGFGDGTEGTIGIRKLRSQDRMAAQMILASLAQAEFDTDGVDIRPFSDGSSCSSLTSRQNDTGNSRTSSSKQEQPEPASQDSNG